MTISTTTSAVSYNGNGAQTEFAFGFLMPEGALRVYLTENDVMTLVSPEEYSVSGFDEATGGSVTFTVAPTADQIVTLRRYLNPTQATDLLPPITTYVDAVEDALDRQSMVMQQLQYDVGRSIKAPMGSNIDPDEIVSTIQSAANTAASSAAGAANSATTAAQSATNATDSAAAAAQSATDAAASVTAAGQAESAASTSANSAENSADTAVQSATAAATSATAAANSAEEAKKNGMAPTGAVMAFAMAIAPEGWLECDGAAVSRQTYADLYAALGDIYGSGDGSTTFNLPDLRGEFLRGWDNGRGIDADREIGSAQGDATKEESGTFGCRDVTGLGASIFCNSSGVFSLNGGNDHGFIRDTGAPVDGVYQSVTLTIGDGSETRPRNVAVMYCIKAN